MWGVALKLLDTNIFVYAQGQPHRYYEPCRSLVASLESESVEYAIDAELLQEILHVYSARGERPRALRTFDCLLVLFPSPIPVTTVELGLARIYLQRYSALSARDAIHAAVVETHNLEGIVSTDKVFTQISGLQVFDPLDLASTVGQRT